MKSLLFAPAILSFISAEPVTEPAVAAPSVPGLFAMAQVAVPRPIVELQAPPRFLPVVAQDEEAAPDDRRLNALKGELAELGESLKATQQAVENVAAQRDAAREEVRALAKANHDILQEMKTFRGELEAARAEAGKWKDHAARMERKANDQALANAALDEFRKELQGAMQDFQAMKGDFAKARDELVDPIERANLKQELAQSKAKQERLGAEIEMALIAREKTIQETEQVRREMEGRMAVLTKEAQSAKELRDELRSANAVKMKSLADVEVLRKDLAQADATGKEMLAKLETAQNGLTALQAEKAAAMEARAVAMQERDAARSVGDNLQKQVDAALAQLEKTQTEMAAVTAKVQSAEEAMVVTVRERDAAQKECGELQKQVGNTLVQIESAAKVMVKLSAKLHAADEGTTAASRERDGARSELACVQEQAQTAQQELAAVKKEATKAAAMAKAAEAAHQESAQKLADASGVIERTQEEVQFLNQAKGGLEDLLFKKTAEIRKLKGELRKVQASNDGSSTTPPPTPEDEGERGTETEPSTAQALAD